MTKHLLMGGASRVALFAPDGVGAGGGGAAAGGATTAAPAPADATGGAATSTAPNGAAPGGGEAAAAEGAKAPAAAASVLGAAAEAAAAETPEAKATREAAEAVEREKAEKLKNETPEEKTAREAAEKTTAREATLKTYEALKLPEGMPKEQPAYVDFTAAAADLGLAPEAAQKLIDTVAPKLHEAINAPYEAWATMQEGWIKECKEDKEFGGKDYDANVGLVAARAVTEVAGKDAPKLIAMLNTTGVGNHPEMIRWMYRVGKLLGEGKPVAGGAPGAGERSLAQRVYPEMTPTA